MSLMSFLERISSPNNHQLPNLLTQALNLAIGFDFKSLTTDHRGNPDESGMPMSSPLEFPMRWSTNVARDSPWEASSQGRRTRNIQRREANDHSQHPTAPTYLKPGDSWKSRANTKTDETMHSPCDKAKMANHWATCNSRLIHALCSLHTHE